MLRVWSTPGHLKRECPNRGSGERPKKTDSPPATSSVHTEESRTFMTVKFKNHRIRALLDTGSDVIPQSHRTATLLRPSATLNLVWSLAVVAWSHSIAVLRSHQNTDRNRSQCFCTTRNANRSTVLRLYSEYTATIYNDLRRTTDAKINDLG